MSSSETWNTEVCCTVVAHVVIHSRFVVQPQKSDGNQMKCQCEEPSWSIVEERRDRSGSYGFNMSHPHKRCLVLVKYCGLLDWVTENRLEDRSSQWETTKRSVGLSTARVVDAHRETGINDDWTATVRHLIGVNVQCSSLDGIDRNGDRHRDTSTTVEVVWRQKSTTKLWLVSALSCLHSLACKA